MFTEQLIKYFIFLHLLIAYRCMMLYVKQSNQKQPQIDWKWVVLTHVRVSFQVK